MMQQPVSDDWCVATGEARSIQDFIEMALPYCPGDKNWYRERIRTSPRYERPLEVPHLCGDSSKIRAIGWKPEVDLPELVERMMKYDMQLAYDEKHGTRGR